MRAKHLFLFLLLFCQAPFLWSYSITREALLLEADKFLFSAGVQEYYKRGQGSVFILPFVVQLGLAKRVEFIGVFPYIQLRQKNTGEIDTFGDILLFLKFRMMNFNYTMPLVQRPVFNQLAMVLKFNTATGPSKEQIKEFSPYSIGLADISLGLYYSQIIDDLSFDLNFLYTFAAHIGEEYLPFSDSFWSSSKKSYFFDIHKVLVKFFWPGKYPWAKAEAAVWEKDPHIDDYFNFDIGFSYALAPSWSLFSYDLFVELNWLRSWSVESIYQERVLITPGIQVTFFENFMLVGSVSLLVHKPGDYYYHHLYYMGMKFLL
jgi:hypothetical protein